MNDSTVPVSAGMFYLDGNQLLEACSKGDEMCRCIEGFNTCWKRAPFMMVDFLHCAFGASAAFGGKTVEEAIRAPKGVLPSPELLWESVFCVWFFQRGWC